MVMPLAGEKTGSHLETLRPPSPITHMPSSMGVTCRFPIFLPEPEMTWGQGFTSPSPLSPPVLSVLHPLNKHFAETLHHWFAHQRHADVEMPTTPRTLPLLSPNLQDHHVVVKSLHLAAWGRVTGPLSPAWPKRSAW